MIRKTKLSKFVLKMNTFLILAVFCLLLVVPSQSKCPEGWTKWRDEKCYSVQGSFLSYKAAKQNCAAKGGFLATIKEEAQQTFLDNFIYHVSSIEDEVWLGATRVNTTNFKWEDGTPLDYANWAPDSPSEVAGRGCVVMQSLNSKQSNPEGRWRDVSCTRPNLFVCESEPVWSPEEVRKVLVETRKKLDNLALEHGTLVEHHEDLVAKHGSLDARHRSLDARHRSLDAKHEILTARHQNLIQNPVPVGFIYTQLPGQPVPSSLWPNIRWREISSQFAGKFFRVVGGAAAAFGTTQNAESPRLTQVKYVGGSGSPYLGQVNTVPGRWSEGVTTGGYDGNWVSTSFYVSNPEIRPVNTAVRIWNREA